MGADKLVKIGCLKSVFIFTFLLWINDEVFVFFDVGDESAFIQDAQHYLRHTTEGKLSAVG